MGNIKVKINGMEVEAPAGSTILETARLASVDIPTLCYLKGLNEIGACRMCMVEINTSSKLVPSCVYPINPQMEIWTDTADVLASRRQALELICSNHRMDCEYCPRYSDCEFHALCRKYAVDTKPYELHYMASDCDESAVHLIRDNSKCVLCRRCIAACRSQGVNTLEILGRGLDTHIGPPVPMADTTCVHCGQCIAACPTGALSERDDTRKVWQALSQEKFVIAIVSPFVNAQMGECFLDDVGSKAEGKTVAALRRIGFSKIFDLGSFGAVAVMEQSEELLQRKKSSKSLPMLSSSCPSFVKFCETYYPEFLENLSICKGPAANIGLQCKTWYANKAGIEPKDIFVVSVLPCTAGKYECARPELTQNGSPYVDVSITTRELAAMFKRACVSNFTALKVWNELPSETFDKFPNLDNDGVFDLSGGVMKSVLCHIGNNASINSVAISGLSNAANLLDLIKSGSAEYDFVEIMACPGGCINGGGQPHKSGGARNFAIFDVAKALTL